MSTGKLRLDKYLWAIRLFKTRSQAAEAISKGKVYFNGAAVKASKQVAHHDEYEVKTGDKKWKIKVSGLLSNRVAYAEAIKFYIDLTPGEAVIKKEFFPAAFYTGKRMSKTGKPTKKQNRDRDSFFNKH